MAPEPFEETLDYGWNPGAAMIRRVHNECSLTKADQRTYHHERPPLSDCSLCGAIGPLRALLLSFSRVEDPWLDRSEPRA
jgi:hypothetical protein